MPFEGRGSYIPLFDFVCANCKGEFKDVMVRSALHHHYSPACPKCGKIGSLQKQPSRSAFVVKGFNAKNGYSGGK